MKPETITQRVGVSDGELVVFDETTEGVFKDMCVIKMRCHNK